MPTPLAVLIRESYLGVTVQCQVLFLQSMSLSEFGELPKEPSMHQKCLSLHTVEVRHYTKEGIKKERQTDRQTDRKTERERERERASERDGERILTKHEDENMSRLVHLHLISDVNTNLLFCQAVTSPVIIFAAATSHANIVLTTLITTSVCPSTVHLSTCSRSPSQIYLVTLN